jgi:hypothetical protein
MSAGVVMSSTSRWVIKTASNYLMRKAARRAVEDNISRPWLKKSTAMDRAQNHQPSRNSAAPVGSKGRVYVNESKQGGREAQPAAPLKKSRIGAGANLPVDLCRFQPSEQVFINLLINARTPLKRIASNMRE